MTSGIQEANHARVLNALLIMVLDEKIQRFLLRNDPKAYNQALDAVVGYLTIEQKVNISTIAEEVSKENFCTGCQQVIDMSIHEPEGFNNRLELLR